MNHDLAKLFQRLIRSHGRGSSTPLVRPPRRPRLDPEPDLAILFTGPSGWDVALGPLPELSRRSISAPPPVQSNYAACIIFFIRSFMSCGETSSMCVATPHRCPNGS